jgi:hypothetical protein
MFVFRSLTQSLTVVLRPTKKIVVGTEVIREPGLRAEFTKGIFETDDEQTAELLRKVMKKDQTIIEITEADRQAVEASIKAESNTPLNLRGPVTASSVKGTGSKPKVEEKVTPMKCPLCDEEFKSRQNLDIHLVSHRQSVQAVKEAEKSVPA